MCVFVQVHWTPLHIAAVKGQEGLVHTLLQHVLYSPSSPSSSLPLSSRHYYLQTVLHARNMVSILTY